MMPGKSLRSRVEEQGQCTEPDRDAPKLTCGQPLPCSHHGYKSADNFNRSGNLTFKTLQPETQEIIRSVLAKQVKPDEKASPVEGDANSIASDCIGKDKSPPERLEQVGLTVKLIVVDEKICFIMNKPVDWLGFDREAAENIGKQLIALARGTK